MLTIANFEANYFLPAGTSERASVQSRLDRIARQRLIEEIGERLAPAPSDADAVYRIRDLRVELWLDALGMSDGEIAGRWSSALAGAIVRTLLRAPPSQMVRYDDHAHFVAAFLADLMTGQAWSRWVYEEFAPLRTLSVGQIAANLLAPRPALLVAVAERLDRDGRLEPLLHQLEPADARLIWEQGLGFDALPDAPVRGEILGRVLDALRDGVALERGNGVAVAFRNALRTYLQAVIAQPSLAKHRAVGTISRHLALLNRVWSTRPSAWLWKALASGEIASPAAVAPVLDGLGPEMAVARDWLKVTLAQSSGRAYLARLVPVVVPEAGMASEVVVSEDGRLEPATPRQVATSFAGLALLLPAIRDLGLHEYLGREGLYQVLLQAVGSRYQPLAWSDAAPGLLADVPPQKLEGARKAEVEWPGVALWDAPDIGESDARHLGTSPGAVFALLVLRRFARDLRGFAGSSAAYLAEQFINVPGYLLVDSDNIEAHLSRAPLGIVLQMAGKTGDCGPVPWLDGRHLWVYLP